MKKAAFSLIFALLIIVTTAPMAFANSGGPYSLTVIVEAPPDGLNFSILLADGTDTGSLYGSKRGREVSYTYYFFEKNDLDGAAVQIRANELILDCPIPVLKHFNDTMLLDIESGRFSQGKLAFRAVKLVSARVFFTLIIEGFVFLMFLYRTKRSWFVFASVNLVTQSLFNVFLFSSGISKFAVFYGLVLLPIELVIIIVEAVLFVLLLKEHTHRRAAGFAAVGNITSWLLGILLISFLAI